MYHRITTKNKIFPDTPVHGQPSMKAIDVCDFDIIKCGVEFVTGVGARPGVDDLLPHMERNENYVYPDYKHMLFLIDRKELGS